MDFITIASTGNATDFGDAMASADAQYNSSSAVASNGHGGIA